MISETQCTHCGTLGPAECPNHREVRADIAEAIVLPVLHYIDRVFPEMWAVHPIARTSVRNTITREVLAALEP